MTAVAITQLPGARLADDRVAIVAWRQRVLRISSLCEVLFGTLWLTNATHASVPAAAPLVALIGAIAFTAAIRMTRGLGPRPSGTAARALERRITIASVAQIAATVAVPAVLIAAGRGSLVMPAIVLSVGALFVSLHRELDLPRLGALGDALVVVPIITTLALSGTARTSGLLVVAGTLMVATGISGIRTQTRAH